MPLGLSPTAMQRMAHPDGELASARGKYYQLKLQLNVVIDSTLYE